MALPLGSAAQRGYDDETAALIFKLQLEDIDELLDTSNRKGKGKEGVVSDQEVAFKLEKEELERNAMILLDRSMSKSIARAVFHDSDQIAYAEAQEMQAFVDRIIALRLGGVQVDAYPTTVARPAPSVVSENLDDELIEKLSAIYHETPTEDNDHNAMVKTLVKRARRNGTGQNAESSTWAATRKVERSHCVICEESVPFYDVARLPCDHECCRACLMEMFQAATVDESRYPPKCCQEISPYPENVRLFLTMEMINKYLEKKIEWETKNRIYCANKQCGKFIRTEFVYVDDAHCPACDSLTCTMCQEAAHNSDCSKDEELLRTLELVKENGWRRCESCRRIIELKHGCNHIALVLLFLATHCYSTFTELFRCPCQAEFCYVCGLKWKTCGCDNWDEDRLMLRANDVVDRGDHQNAVARLNAEADCNHDGFMRLREGGDCEDCGDHMYRFIFECNQCPLRLCLRCRRTRV